MGVQILCAQYRGRGDNESMRTLFDSAILFLGAASLTVSAVFFFGRAGLSEILGAQGQDALFLQDYIAGYSLSVIGQALYPLLLYMGAFGFGLATSLSYLLTCVYVFRKFLVGYGWGQTTFATIR